MSQHSRLSNVTRINAITGTWLKRPVRIAQAMLISIQAAPKRIDCIAEKRTNPSRFSRIKKMMPPTRGIQARAAATFEGRPLDVDLVIGSGAGSGTGDTGGGGVGGGRAGLGAGSHKARGVC